MSGSTPRHVIYWQRTKSVEPGRRLTDDLDCDVAIVGGGLAGLWTAYQLLTQGVADSVCVLERDFCGSGASGAADGFVTPTLGKDAEALVKQVGPDRAAAALQQVGRSLLDLGRFVRRHHVDAAYVARDYLMLATCASQAASLKQGRNLIEQLSGRSAPPILDSDAVREIIDTPRATAGMLMSGGLVNPFKLTRELMRVAVDLGATVLEQSHVLSIEPGLRPIVVTDTARVRARTLVVTTNVDQPQFPPFRSSVLPLWSYALITASLSPEEIARVHWPDRNGVVEAKTFLTCARFVDEDRVMFAGGRARHLPRAQSPMSDQRAYRELAEQFRQTFPAWCDVSFDYAYGGRIDITRDLRPHFGRLSGNVVYGYGFCGNGIAATHLAGRILTDLVAQRDSELARLALVDRAPLRAPRVPTGPLVEAPLAVGSALLDRWERR